MQSNGIQLEVFLLLVQMISLQRYMNYDIVSKEGTDV